MSDTNPQTDARDRIAAALSSITVIGGCPPELLVPVVTANSPNMARIVGWQPLAGVVDALLAAVVPVPVPAPTNRAVLREAADALDGLTQETAAADMTMPEGRWRAGLDAGVRELRRMADCHECETGAEHTVHCPTPETHNWGCGCPTDPVPATGPGRVADETQQPKCSASVSGSCLRESQSETACDTEAGECVHGGKPVAEALRPETHRCDNCDGIDPDTCFMNPNRPPEQCPAAEFVDYGAQCQKAVGHELHTFDEQPAVVSEPVQHAPGTAILCADCRTKGHAVFVSTSFGTSVPSCFGSTGRP